MKKLLFVGLLVALMGCGRDNSRFDVPFIVRSIDYIPAEGCCAYTGLYQEGNDGPFKLASPMIYAPCGMYQIGDTIKLTK